MPVMETLAIASAIAGGLQSIFGGQAASAEQQRRNEEAYRNWIASNAQKTFNNAREQFQATFNFSQQLKRNAAIAQSAYQYQSDAKEIAKQNFNNTQNTMSKSLLANSGSLVNAITARGVSTTSGLYGSLATMQALDALDKSSQLNQAYKQELKNIDTQTKSMFSQQTENIFMPNIQNYDAQPIYGDSSASAIGGLVSGVLQIGSGFIAAGLPTNTTNTNQGTVSVTPATPTSSRITQPTSRASFITRR